MNYLLLISLLLLAGCGTTTKPVNIPVPVPCISPENDPRKIKPDFTDLSVIAKMENYLFVKTISSDLSNYQIYTKELETVIEGCVE